MSSIYPDAIDGYAQLPLVIDTVTQINADTVNRLRSAIVNIENELGIVPRGKDEDVAARLDRLESEISEFESDITIIENNITTIENNITTIEADLDGVSKVYKAPCRLATTENNDLTLFSATVVDGTALEVGDRVLAWNQTDASENGIYRVDTLSSPDATASGTLNVLGVLPTIGSTITIDGKVYTLTSPAVNDGDIVPSGGTLISILLTFLDRINKAINLTGIPGVDYAAATTKHPTVTSTVDALSLIVTANEAGTVGNLIETTENTNFASWEAPTLEGGTNLADGSWVRDSDMDDVEEDHIEAGLMTYIQEGDLNARSTFTLTTTGDITLGTTELEFIGSRLTMRSDASGTDVLGTAGTPQVLGTADTYFAQSGATDTRDYDTAVWYVTVTDKGTATSITVKVEWLEDGSNLGPQGTEDILSGASTLSVYEASYDISGETAPFNLPVIPLDVIGPAAKVSVKADAGTTTQIYTRVWRKA